MAEVLLDIHGATYTYSAVPALDGITFTLRQGEMLAVVGPNGSGKSTLVKCISRALRPKVGTVWLAGRDVCTYSARELARQLAVVPQETAIDFDFSAAEVILMGRQPHIGPFQHESSRDLAIMRKAMELTSTLHLADRTVATLSGGERQRVVIARALAQEPQVLLLDEPTSHLDITYQVEILELLGRLNREKKLTIIAVLHDLNLAAQYFHKFLLLAAGKIIALGPAEEVLTRENLKKAYASDVVISRHPMNGQLHISWVPTKNKSGVYPGYRPAVHLIGGGGTAGRIMEAMAYAGWTVTAGVLNRGDTDWDQGRLLGIQMVEIPPFAPIGEEDQQRNLALMKQADCVLVAEVPFGPGNIQNLYVVQEAQAWGMPLFLVGAKPVAERDYTGGLATRIYERLIEKGAYLFKEPAQALEAIAAGGGQRERGARRCTQREK